MNYKYPFKFLDAYTLEDKDIFFGRNEEIDELYEMNFQTNLTLVYGASGTGKTSLLQCGLANKFTQYDWHSISIRRGGGLNESFTNALFSNLGDDVIQNKNTSIKELVESVYYYHYKPLYLIFDQFEELYILGSKSEQEQFIENIKVVLNCNLPVKVIVSIREEYLGYLYDFEKAVPQLLRKKLRVEAMNLDKVKTVLLSINQFENSNVKLQTNEEENIAETVFAKILGNEKSLTISLPYLQVYMDKLYIESGGDKERLKTATLNMNALQTLGDLGDVLRNLLDEQVAHIAAKLKLSAEDIWHILSPFVTLDGTKEPLTTMQLFSRANDIDRDTILNVLQAFNNSRILRYSEKDQNYEVAHDSLAKQIHAKRSDDEIALLEVQRLIKGQALIKEDAREYFTEKQLIRIEPFISRLNLTEEENKWVELSLKNLQEQKEEEKIRHFLELSRSKKRTALLAIFLVILSALLLVTIYLFTKTKYTEKQLHNQNEELKQKEIKLRNFKDSVIQISNAVKKAKADADSNQKALLAQQKATDSLKVATVRNQEQAQKDKLIMEARLVIEDVRKTLVEMESKYLGKTIYYNLIQKKLDVALKDLNKFEFLESPEREDIKKLRLKIKEIENQINR